MSFQQRSPAGTKRLSSYHFASSDREASRWFIDDLPIQSPTYAPCKQMAWSNTCCVVLLLLLLHLQDTAFVVSSRVFPEFSSAVRVDESVVNDRITIKSSWLGFGAEVSNSSLEYFTILLRSMVDTCSDQLICTFGPLAQQRQSPNLPVRSSPRPQGEVLAC